MYYRRITALLTLLAAILLAAPLKAQDLPPGFKTWGRTALGVRVSPKTTFSVSQLTAFNQGPFQFQFLQANMGASRKIGDRWNIDAGYARSWFKSRESIKIYNRVFTEVDFKQKWGNFAMKNSLRAEYHFPSLRKWRTRYIYSNKISYRFRDLPMRPQPYLRNQLYWYQGGRDVSYFDEESGELLAQQAPNGIHRYRLTAGIRMRLAKRLYGSVFYTWQKELNMPWQEFRGLNVENLNGNIQAPFNNFSLIGFSIDYTLKLY